MRSIAAAIARERPINRASVLLTGYRHRFAPGGSGPPWPRNNRRPPRRPSAEPTIPDRAVINVALFMAHFCGVDVAAMEPGPCQFAGHGHDGTVPWRRQPARERG